MGIAKPARMVPGEVFIKLLVWGEPGSGKSRFALSAPTPLVADFEGSTRLYDNEFEFWRAEVDPREANQVTPVHVTRQLVREILAGEYQDRKTLVIDPLTDLLDYLETECVAEYEQQIGKKVASLGAMDKTKWYAYRRDRARKMLDALKSLPMNLILVARSKLLWESQSGKMQPNGSTYDALNIVEYLMDVVIELRKDKQDDFRAIVKKSRLGNLPDELPVKNYSSIMQALEQLVGNGNNKPVATVTQKKKEEKSEESSLAKIVSECEKLAKELNGKIEEAFKKAKIQTIEDAEKWRDRLQEAKRLYDQNIKVQPYVEAFKKAYQEQPLKGLVDWLQAQIPQTQEVDVNVLLEGLQLIAHGDKVQLEKLSAVESDPAALATFAHQRITAYGVELGTKAAKKKRQELVLKIQEAVEAMNFQELYAINEELLAA